MEKAQQWGPGVKSADAGPLQTKWTVKRVQGMLRHNRTATTTDVYMQEMPEGVRATVRAISAELRKEQTLEAVGVV